jgi:hypothetical protein
MLKEPTSSGQKARETIVNEADNEADDGATLATSPLSH